MAHVSELIKLLERSLDFLNELKDRDESELYGEDIPLIMHIERIKQAVHEEKALKIGHLARS